jgi:hypothetical protein
MSKKVFFSTILVLVLALMMSGTAFAATSSTTTRQANRVGMVTAAGNGNLTIQTISGQLFTVKVGATTQYQRVSGGYISFRNIDVGQWITAIGTFDRQRVLNADTIVVMPARINKGKWINARAYGTVLQVLPGNQTFTLITANGRMQFNVDDTTHFTGNSVRNFGALQAGMTAVVSYTMDRQGNLYASGVAAY